MDPPIHRNGTVYYLSLPVGLVFAPFMVFMPDVQVQGKEDVYLKVYLISHPFIVCPVVLMVSEGFVLFVCVTVSW